MITASFANPKSETFGVKSSTIIHPERLSASDETTNPSPIWYTATQLSNRCSNSVAADIYTLGATML